MPAHALHQTRLEPDAAAQAAALHVRGGAFRRRRHRGLRRRAAIPQWRWMLDRDETPWYPSLRLFRRGQGGDWAEVVARVAAAARLALG